jgi:hypothetical protein
MKNKNKVYIHGECMCFPSSLPSTVKKKVVDRFLIVADSETTGNHHVVDAEEGVDFYEDTNGTLFMNVEKSATLRCVHSNRHDAIVVGPGTYEFGTQMEYDPFTARLNKVRD